MDVAAGGNEIGPTPPMSRTVVALRRIPLPEALGRVAAISLVIAILIFAGLTLQMSLGGDPALGSKVSAGAASAVGSSPRVTPTASTEGDDASAISAALAAQAQAQMVVPAQSVVPTPTAVAPTPSPPPTPVQTSTS
jgi:hypothetical protein